MVVSGLSNQYKLVSKWRRKWLIADIFRFPITFISKNVKRGHKAMLGNLIMASNAAYFRRQRPIDKERLWASSVSRIISSTSDDISTNDLRRVKRVALGAKQRPSPEISFDAAVD